MEEKIYIFVFAATAPKPWEDTQEINKNYYLLRLGNGKNKVHVHKVGDKTDIDEFLIFFLLFE